MHVSQQDLPPTTRNKICRQQREEMRPRKREIVLITLVVTSMATMKKIFLCVLLAFFFPISSLIHLHSCRDYGFELVVLLLLAVCQIVFRD
jgi:uncharacterized membrane protein